MSAAAVRDPLMDAIRSGDLSRVQTLVVSPATQLNAHQYLITVCTMIKGDNSPLDKQLILIALELIKAGINVNEFDPANRDLTPMNACAGKANINWLLYYLTVRGAPQLAASPCPTIISNAWDTYSKIIDLAPSAQRAGQDTEIRRSVLRDTLNKLDRGKLNNILQRAYANMQRWRGSATPPALPFPLVEIYEGDWGEITKGVSEAAGEIYAVLNMANSAHPGGGYQWGAPAQEENMFYRSSCHFYISRQYDVAGTDYNQPMIDLIEATHNVVYLDTICPRVCIKSKEIADPTGRINEPISYIDNPDNYFLFYEMRAAADDLRARTATGDLPFNRASMYRKIYAQFRTLADKGIRRVVLSAFGCGAFKNPAADVADIYRSIIARVNIPADPFYKKFDHIVFAIYTGSAVGPANNYIEFSNVLRGLSPQISVRSVAADATIQYELPRSRPTVTFNPVASSNSGSVSPLRGSASSSDPSALIASTSSSAFFSSTAPASAAASVFSRSPSPGATSSSPAAAVASSSPSAVVGARSPAAAGVSSSPSAVVGASTKTPAAPSAVVGASTKSPVTAAAGGSPAATATPTAGSAPPTATAAAAAPPTAAATAAAISPTAGAAPPTAAATAAPPATTAAAAISPTAGGSPAPPAPPTPTPLTGAPPAPTPPAPTPAPPSANPIIPLYNFFLKNKPVDNIFNYLDYKPVITVSPIEAPYFSLLCQKSLHKIDKWLTERPFDISANKFPVVTGNFATLVNPGKPLLEELAFLEHQCLAFKRGTTYYISDFASLYYGANGLFAQYKAIPPSTQLVLTSLYAPMMANVGTLFLTYVLPGQFWRRYYVLYPLPKTIFVREALDKELEDIELVWKGLYQIAD